jgi:3-dehydroquinate synthetase
MNAKLAHAPLLNLGHTFGHAFEAVANYDGRLLHGEAVAAGMGLAFDLSVELGLCPQQDADRCKHHLRHSGLPSGQKSLPAGNASAKILLAHMKHDKKTRNGVMHLVLGAVDWRYLCAWRSAGTDCDSGAGARLRCCLASGY